MDLDAIEAAIRTAEAPVVTVKEWRRARDLLMDSAPEMVAEIRRLRELCGQAAFEQDIAERAGYGALSRGTHDRLRAAAKGGD